MLIWKFPHETAAIAAFTKNHCSYPLIRHKFAKLEEARVNLHYHIPAEEWLLIRTGNFLVRVGNEVKHCWLFPKNEVYMIHFPKKTAHAFYAFAAIEYLVLRDKPARSVYVKNDTDKLIRLPMLANKKIVV
jgi:hypothetical protein